MPTIEDIMRHVEANPNDHKERWRLAKKLYSQCEYRQALEHLRVLKRDWKRRQNVSRYLAATYYRLGRYDDAIAELEFAIREWPDEVGLREQIARVYEIAGRRDEAGTVWQGILMMNTRHPMAERALERLQRPPEDTPEDDLKLLESDSGIDLAPVVVCPSCGAQNSEEFERCWQCHGPLHGELAPSPISFEAAPPLMSTRAVRPIMGTLGVIAAAGAVYFSLRYVAPHLAAGGNGIATDSLSNAVQFGLAVPRLAAGLAWAIAWPLALSVAMRMVRVKLWPEGQPWGLGLTLAGLAYTALWLPFPIVPYALGTVAVVGIVMTCLIYPVSVVRGITGGMIHAAVAIAVGLGALVALAGTEPVEQFSAISDAIQSTSGTPATPRERNGESVYTFDHSYASTGSTWLDNIVGTVDFVVDAEVTEPMLRVEFRDDTTLLELKDMGTPSVVLTARVKPDTPYRLIVTGKDGVPVTIRARSALLMKEAT